jgi:hypothetical protein
MRFQTHCAPDVAPPLVCESVYLKCVTRER